MTTTTAGTAIIDEAKLKAFVGQAVVDMGAAISGLLPHIGDWLGPYKAMAGAVPMTSATLAGCTGTTERYVREWLGNQAAGGYVVYDPAGGTYELPAEQAMVIADARFRGCRRDTGGNDARLACLTAGRYPAAWPADPVSHTSTIRHDRTI